MNRIDKRVVLVVLVALAFVGQAALAGVAYYVREQKELDVEQRLEQLRELREEQELRQRMLPFVDVDASSPRWQLMRGPDVVGTLQALQQLGDDAGITFDSQTATRAANEGKQPFRIVGHGTPEQVCTFVAGVEEHDRLMIVETGRLMAGGEGEVAFEFGVATYHGGGR